MVVGFEERRKIVWIQLLKGRRPWCVRSSKRRPILGFRASQPDRAYCRIMARCHGAYRPARRLPLAATDEIGMGLSPSFRNSESERVPLDFLSNGRFSGLNPESSGCQ
jgi:hypothetical protein